MFDKIDTLNFHNKNIKFYVSNKTTTARVKKIWKKEPITIEWMNGIKKDDIVIDIGANIGMYTLMSGVGREAIVYGFEPAASNYHLLLKNIKLNSMHNRIKTYCAGVLDYDGFSDLNIDDEVDDTLGGSNYSVDEEVGFDLKPMRVGFKQGINVITLDSFCRKMKIIPDHIKIDVDGLEHRVIKGALESIAQAKTVIIELNTNLKEHKVLVSLIKSLGFKLDEKQVNQSLRKDGIYLNVGEHLFYK